MNAKTIILGLVVAAAVIGTGVFLTSDRSSENVAGQRAGLQEFIDGIRPGEVTIQTKAVSIPLGSDNFVYTNKSGKVQYVDLLALHTSSVASSTQTLTAGTSTSATAWNGFSVPQTLKSFFNITVATSSIATTTNSIQGSGATTGSGAGVAYLGIGESLIVGVYQTFGNKCTGALCETATSTNRGYTVSGFLRILTP